MSENLILMIAVLLKNLIVTISFVVLAIVFNTWWISLFSLLFLTTIEKKVKIEKEGNKDVKNKR